LVRGFYYGKNLELMVIRFWRFPSPLAEGLS